MTKQEYNGWTNYETWNVKLWMDNDQGCQEAWQEQAQECFDRANADDTFTKEENAAFELADRLKLGHEEAANNWMKDQSSVFADLLNASLSEVNWHEIAKSLLEDVDKAVESED